jgi:septal ring factor EnvC (AmiA/AmiB activator)
MRWLPLAGLLLIAAPLHADDPQQTRSQLEQLKKELGKLQGVLNQFKGERSRLQSELKKSEQEINTSERRIREIQQQLQQQQQELDNLEQQQRQLEKDRNSQRGHIERQVQGAYQLGRQSKMKALLNQEDPARLSRTLVYYDYFNRARADQIDAYIDLLSELDAVKPQIEAKTEQLRAARGELDQRQRQLLSARQERERALAKLNATIKNKDQEYKQMAQDRSALETLLKRLEREALAAAEAARKRQQQQQQKQSPGRGGSQGGVFDITATSPVAGGKPFGQLRGQLPWPVAGKAINRFGSQRGNSQLRWQGINIAAREGDTVRAIHNGKVVFADWLRGSGLLLIVDHGGGFLSLYAHNQTLLRNVGDTVRAGDPIATVGSSGGQDQAGLYFEIRHKGVPADPAQWCRRA